jgi:predicted unusual protein kinase regulating ubiquinone biosynthesis (AarF/ABC1/UbiB family)
VAGFRRALAQELDYRREANNLVRLSANLFFLFSILTSDRPTRKR